MVSRTSRWFLGVLAAAALAACSGGVGSLPKERVAPTPLPRFGEVGGHQIYTIYAFHNSSGEFSLPTSPSGDGAEPKGTLTLVAVAGTKVLYGRTAAGGNGTGCGVVFRLPIRGSYSLVYSFSGTDGCSPRHDAMIADPNNGLLYSTTQGLNDSGSPTYNNGQILTFDPNSLAVSTIHSFGGAPSDGAQQHSSFSIDPSSGVLYGQSALGGANDSGYLYSIAAAGGATSAIHSFSHSEGEQPHGRILLVGNTLWGITRKGGSSDYGTVFSMAVPTPGPTAPPLVVVHTFTGAGSDGSHSDHGYLTAVASGTDTILYGMTQCGGTGRGGDESDCSGMGSGDGVIFQIDTATGSYSTFYQFTGTNNNDGADPYGSLLYDPVSGYLYGTTRLGGSHDKGTVFRIAPRAFGTPGSIQQIYHFDGSNGDGAYPIDNVILDGGTLYGMTTEGGSSKDDGTVFALPI